VNLPVATSMPVHVRASGCHQDHVGFLAFARHVNRYRPRCPPSRASVKVGGRCPRASFRLAAQQRLIVGDQDSGSFRPRRSVTVKPGLPVLARPGRPPVIEGYSFPALRIPSLESRALSFLLPWLPPAAVSFISEAHAWLLPRYWMVNLAVAAPECLITFVLGASVPPP